MKKLLTFLAVLVLSVVFYSQDKALANSTLEDDTGSQPDIIQIQEKLSVIKPIELNTGENIIESTVTSNNIYILDTAGKKVSSKVLLLDDKKTVMVVPTNPLKYATKYEVIITTDVQPTSGVNETEKIYRFTTVAKPKNAKEDVTKAKKPVLTNSELEYLLSTAFSSKQPKITKWSSGLNVALLGSPTAADKKEVNKVLKEISTLTGLSTKVTSAKNANIKIYFGNESYGEKHMNMGKIPPYTYGGYKIKPTQKFYISTAQIFVNSTASVTVRKHTIRKALTVSLGFPSQTYSSSSSIFYALNKGTSYNDLDKKIIKALYSPYTPVGTTKEQLREMYRN